MMRFLAKGTIVLLFLLLPCSNALSDIDNPHKNLEFWAKGQVHCHSMRSDGSLRDYTVGHGYALKGYTFFCLTDHSDGDPPDGSTEIRPMSLDIILDDCTFDDDEKKRFIIDDQGIPRTILYIPSIEADDSAGVLGCWKRDADRHFLGLNISTQKIHDVCCPPKKGIKCFKSSQDQINSTINQGGIAVLAHPKDKKSSWNTNDCIKYKNYHGIQFNGEHEDRLEPTIKQWDAILYTGRKVWMFGGDDWHGKDKAFDRGYIMVNLPVPPQDYLCRAGWSKNSNCGVNENVLRQRIIDNIKNGNFYAVYCKENGKGRDPTHDPPMFEDIEVLNGDTIQVTTTKSCSFTFVAGIREPNSVAETYYREVNDYTVITAEKTTRFSLPNKGTSATFPLFDYLQYPSLYRYVRIEAKDDYGNILYSQPIFIEGVIVPKVGTLDIYAEGNLLAKERIIVGQNLVIYGDLQTNSNNKSIVKTDNFGLRKLYADESTEVMLFERGTAQLKDGQVTVHLDPMFLEMVAIDDNNPVIIKITLTSDCKGIYVSKKTANSFTIKEIEGSTSRATFNWEAAAKRKGYEDIRLKELSTE